MNLNKSFYLIGNFIIYYGFFLLFPLFSYFIVVPSDKFFSSNDFLFQLIPFVISSALSLSLGYAIKKIFYDEESSKEDLTRKDGFLLASLVWIFAGFLGSLPYFFSSINIYETIGFTLDPVFKEDIFVNSFFESVSGITTTGASVFSIFPSTDSHSFLIFWRSLSQWLGGIGIILLVLIVFPRISVGIMQIASDQEGTGPQKERITPRIYETGLRLFFIYLGITVLLACLLFFVGKLNLFDSIVHTLSTVSTGGFSSYPLNIEALNNIAVETILTIFMFLGGISFAIYYFVLSGNYKKIIENSEFKTFISLNLILIMFIVYLLFAYNGYSFIDSLRYGSFQSISLSTGTGFTSFNFNNWPNNIKLVLLAFMLLGGCSGSTTGGIKIVRVIIVFKRIHNEIKRRISPNTVSTVKINGKSVDEEVVTGVFSFLLLYLIICIFSVVALLIFENDVKSLTALSAVISSITNVGPGFDQINPHSNYAFFSNQSKILLSFLMFFGRLELFTMVALLIPSFWKKY